MSTNGLRAAKVKLLGNDDWSAILDFQVELVADSAVWPASISEVTPSFFAHKD